jgi:hypothetical protein
MKVIGAIEVDLDRSPLGTRSRLADSLAGHPVLRRTVERALRSARLSSLHLLISPEEHDQVAALLTGLNITVDTHAAGPPVWSKRVRHARKWGLNGWRGGVGGLCWFDEQIHAGALAALGRREHADAVASIPGTAVLLDPALLDQMVEHFERLAEDTRMVFCQAPPGLAPFLARPDILEELHQAGHPPGALVTYLPDNPQLDLTTRPCCYLVPSLLVESQARLLADTRRSVELLTRLLSTIDPSDLSSSAICQALTSPANRPLDPLPVEVEIELTTNDQLSDTSLRPRGVGVPQRGPLSLELIRLLAKELSSYDDTLVLLGGFGEPLLHPELADVLHAFRSEGVFGLAIRTNGIALDDRIADLLIDSDVDVANVTLDAHSASTYRTLHNADCFDRVTANVEALMARRRERKAAGPLIVPELAKVRATMPELEAFFDHWLRRVGWANLVSPPHYAGQMTPQAVLNMAPPQRGPCRRLDSRIVILADGTVVTCDQDFAARQSVGRVGEKSLSSIWTGPRLQAIREAHASANLSALPLCPHCDEWHRP